MAHSGTTHVPQVKY